MHQDFIKCPPQFVICLCKCSLKRPRGHYIAPLSFVQWIMEQVSAALTATVSFLEKNKKLDMADMAAYAAIESTQVQQLLGQLTGVSLTLDEATRLSESIHASDLNAKRKAALRVALSGSSGNTPPRGRACQKLLSGFFNYLTKNDRALLSDERQHAFARASVLSIRLYMPCEKTMGHITQTCAERFSMGGSPQEKHALLEELKRQLKGQREGLQPKVLEFPGDPRSCPGLEQTFEGDELMPLETCSCTQARKVAEVIVEGFEPFSKGCPGCPSGRLRHATI